MYQSLRYLLCFMLCLPAVVSARAFGDADDVWAASREESHRALDHSVWQGFLDKYVVQTGEPARGWVRYSSVSAEDRSALESYVHGLERQTVRDLPRREQFAYWVNLYNAEVVLLVLEHPGVTSIQEVHEGWFSRGPWQDELLMVEGRRLSLNDIAHHILRPLWREPRIHYVLHQAAIGSPDLPALALTATNTEAVLEAAARAWVNHPRAVALTADGWRLSRLYDWYRADFGDTELELKGALMLHADPALTKQLKTFRSPSYEFDWTLDQAPLLPGS